MKTQETVKAYDTNSAHAETRKPTKNQLDEIVGEAMGIILFMCVAAIVIALTVKFIMWLI